MPPGENTYDHKLADASYSLAKSWHTCDVMGIGADPPEVTPLPPKASAILLPTLCFAVSRHTKGRSDGGCDDGDGDVDNGDGGGNDVRGSGGCGGGDVSGTREMMIEGLSSNDGGCCVLVGSCA